LTRKDSDGNLTSGNQLSYGIPSLSMPDLTTKISVDAFKPSSENQSWTVMHQPPLAVSTISDVLDWTSKLCFTSFHVFVVLEIRKFKIDVRGENCI
jgi:hypothetical protein